MILAGDVGGTNTRLAHVDAADGRLRLVARQVFPSRKYAALADIVEEFIALYPAPVSRACFGVAGPIQGDRCVTTTLAWEVDSRRLAALLGLDAVVLINDLEANAYGLAMLEPGDFVTLNPGVPDAAGNAALIAAGTGLGEAGLHRHPDGYAPFASEGGHADFAPRNALEIELLRHLLERFGRVSYERVVSGPGLVNVYRFLRDTGRGEEPAWIAERLRAPDAAPAISAAALDGTSELCARALDLFVSVYGAEAGNLTLKLLATGGLYVGGGIAPRIIDKLREPAFMTAFTAKGRLSPLLEATPVRVVMNDQTALLGAARRAVLAAGGSG